MFVSKALGLGEKKARGFFGRDRRDFFRVGKARFEIENPQYPPDWAEIWEIHSYKDAKPGFHFIQPQPDWRNIGPRLFWDEIWEMFPRAYTEADIQFLRSAPFELINFFLYQIDPPLTEDSELIALLHYNENHYVVPHLKKRSKHPKLKS